MLNQALGGAEGGGLGTSVPSILDALQTLLDRCDEVVLIPDLGSAVLSAGVALDLLGDEASRVTVVDAPVLEWAMMGAVEASLGSDAAKVASVARDARHLQKLHR